MRHDSPRLRTIVLSLKCNSGGWLLLCLRTNLPLSQGKTASRTSPASQRCGYFQHAAWDLFPEHFLNLADFPLDFSANFLGCAAIAQVWIPRRFSDFFFHFAFGLVDSAFCPFFRARFHTNDSRFSKSAVGTIEKWEKKRNGRSTIPHASSI